MSEKLPHPDGLVLRRIEAAEIQTLVDILGDDSRSAFGKITVVHRADDPIGCAPRVFGLTPRSVNDLDAALASLGDALKACRIEILPGNLNRPVAAALAAHGFRQTEFVTMMYGNASRSTIQPNPGVEVIAVDSDSLFREFVESLQLGWDIPEENRRPAETLQYWRERGDLFVARLNGTPVSASFLHQHDSTAYLGHTASQHVLRRQGGHLALLDRRIHLAAERGCTAVYGQVPFDSPAHRNLARAGLEVAATKATWTHESA